MKLEEILAQVYPNLPAAQRAEYAPLMEDAFVEFGITTKPRLAAVLGQLAVESNELRKWEESLNYSAKRMHEVWPKRFPTVESGAPFAMNPRAFANKVYGGRMGNTGPDDGYNFRGRTPVQLTGRDNYTAVGKKLDLPLADNPDLANDKATAFRVVGCYFRDIRPMLSVADKGDFKAVSRAVNGGDEGMDARLKYSNRAMSVIPDGFKLTASAPPPAVHEEADEEAAAATSPAEEPTPATATQDAQPAPQVVVVETPAQSAPVVVAVTQPAAVQQPAVQPNVVEAAQKVEQSNSSKVTSWFPMIAGPLAAIWLGIKASLENPFVLAAIVLFVVGGFVVGAWLWNESKKRQAAAQHKLIEAAAATDKQTVVINPPPPKAG